VLVRSVVYLRFRAMLFSRLLSFGFMLLHLQYS
jgi:hypothetical protein